MMSDAREREQVRICRACNDVPQWLFRLRRIRAALTGDYAIARDDAAIVLAAIDSAAASTYDAGLRTIEQGLGLPPMWRALKRQAERDEVLRVLAGVGYRGRAGAARLCGELGRYQRGQFQRDLRMGREPQDESSRLFYRFLVVCDGKPPGESHLAKLLK